ncbi:MAG: tetratricopeptide repeat protein [Chromatiales bacterium]|jgi:tetratricopeptide (TPR) repeat protein
MIGRSLAIAAVVALLAGCGADSMLQRKMGIFDAGGAQPSTPAGIEQARAQLQAGRTAESIRLYEQVIDAGGPEREKALYGLALARLQAEGGLRSPQKARAALDTLVKDYPEGERRVEASVLIGLIDAAGRESGQTAALKKSLGEKDRELEAVRSELQNKEEALENLRKALMNR